MSRKYEIVYASELQVGRSLRIAPYLLCFHFTYQTKSSFLYYLTCIQKQSLLQAQGGKRAWVGDYHALPQFISIVYRLHVQM